MHTFSNIYTLHIFNLIIHAQVHTYVYAIILKMRWYLTLCHSGPSNMYIKLFSSHGWNTFYILFQTLI